MKSIRSWLAAAVVVTVFVSGATWAGTAPAAAAGAAGAAPAAGAARAGQPAAGGPLTLPPALPARVSEDAKKAIQTMLAAYGARKDYQAAFTMTTDTQVGKTSRSGSVKGAVRLFAAEQARSSPGETVSFSLSCDGKQCMAYYSMTDKYYTWKAPDNLDSLLGDDALAELLSDMSRVALLPFTSDPYTTFLLGVNSAELAPPEPGKGTHLRLEVQAGELDVWLDPQTSLVTEARAVPTRLIEALKLQHSDLGEVKVAVTFKQQVADAGQPMPADAFSTEPPQGAKQATSWRDMSELSPLERTVDFQLPTMAEDKTVQLSSLKGKVVALDFWATTCEPCKEELPLLQDICDKLAPKGLVLLCVSEGDTREDVAKFLKETGLSFQVALDTDGKVGQTYHVRGVPTLYLIDRDGKIAGFYEGYNPAGMDELRDKITKLVEAKQPQATAPADAQPAAR